MKKHKQNSKSHQWRIILFITISIALIILLGFYLSSVFILKDMATHRVEKFKNTPESLGLDATTISLLSKDGISLKAWYVPANDPRGVVVLLHGMDGMDASSFLPQATYLHEAGYASIVLDMRAHGRSGGNRIGFAFEEPQDVNAALDWVASQNELENVPVALLCFSMGGATAIRTAAVRSDVNAVISVSSFSSIDKMLGQGMLLMGAPKEMIRIYTPFMRLGLLTLYGVWPATASPEHDIAMISPRPVLLLHGSADSQIPVEQAYALKEAGGQNVELQIFEGADHLVFRGDGTGPEDADFRQALLNFLARSLPESQ
jgi:alpha-beta hydrolase superfamily lysophospholipase